MTETAFDDLNALAAHLRQQLEAKKYLLLYAYNGTGKTRLSMEFRTLASRAAGATPCISTPSPRICSPGTMIWTATLSASCK